jgi:adenosylcobinamide-phosphate synthase
MPLITIMASRAIVLFIAIFLDLGLGEPPKRIHPTVFMGREISFLEGRLKRDKGFTIPILVVLSSLLFSLILLSILSLKIPVFLLWLLAAAFLKPTFSVRPLILVPLRIERQLKDGNIEDAKEMLIHLVRRDRDLDEKHVISAAIESVGESGVDSVISPFIFYLLFGLPGAYLFRAVNTLDSMLGYRELGQFGKPSAKLDDWCNIIGARLCAFFYTFPRLTELKEVIKYSKSFESSNASYSISSMAIHLGVNVEKIGHYSLEVGRDPQGEDISRAVICLIKAILLFCIAIFLAISLI